MTNILNSGLLDSVRRGLSHPDQDPWLKGMEALNASAVKLDATNFRREVLGAAEPVLVGFWTEGSNGCIAVAKALETLVEDPSVQFKVGLVNAEKYEALAEQYGVRTVPTLPIFNENGLRGKIVGAPANWPFARNWSGAHEPSSPETTAAQAKRPSNG